MLLKQILFVITLFLGLQIQLQATIYFVSQPTGNDANNGLSTTTAFKTIQKAADLVNPGDVVNVMNGIYTNDCPQCNVAYIQRAGSSSQWITFQNLAGHAPVLQFNGWSGFGFGNNARYIRVTGFEIIGNNNNILLTNALNQPGGCNDPNGDSEAIYNGNGITSDGRNAVQRPHHLKIDHNTIYNCGGGGVAIIQSDFITIEDNLIYNNSWYTIYGASGISLWQNWNSDGTTTTHNFIRRNRCFGNRLYVPWYVVCQFTDGNGIIIDDSNNTQNGSTLGVYSARTLIENNLVWNNGGSGIHTYESQHVDIIHNTAYQNSQTPEIDGGEIFPNASNDIKIVNNILWAPAGNAMNSNYNNGTIIYDYNLHFGGGNAPLLGAHTITANPLLSAPSATLTADFHLNTGSPAINAGDNANSNAADFEGTQRPFAGISDIGAFEKTGTLPVEWLENLDAQIVVSGIELRWATATEAQNALFEIERSAEGRAFSFEKIGEKVARGNAETTHFYQYLDKKPLNGRSYYRLRQLDFDGKSSYSNICSVEFNPRSELSISPNPASEALFFSLENEKIERVEIQNTDGRICQFLEGENLKEIKINDLPKGIFVLKIWNNFGQISQKRFLKL
jgi:hypothetical protein